MGYDPFARGPFSVAVRAADAIDRDRRDRRLPFEVWYPEDGVASTYPMVLYSHASYGHRRQASFLSTHLASHGYVVAAADHLGNATVDFAERSARLATGELRPRTPEEAEAYVRQIIADRVPDLRFLLDRMLSGELSHRIDERRIGLAGWSFGGWAVLATPEADDRIRAVAAMAPAGSSKPLPGIIPATLTFEWKRDVPTIFLAAERDRFTPLTGQYELFERARSSKRMFILRGADHQHFGDQIDEPGACSPEQAHLFTRALALAHMDAVLKEHRAARVFLADDPVAALRERGVEAAYPEAIR
jgi:predicted dienelactone hydrolase